MTTLLQITAPHFCAGLVTRKNITCRPAPIIGYMLGWKTESVMAYCRKKGWELRLVKEEEKTT